MFAKIRIFPDTDKSHSLISVRLLGIYKKENCGQKRILPAVVLKRLSSYVLDNPLRCQYHTPGTVGIEEELHLIRAGRYGNVASFVGHIGQSAAPIVFPCIIGAYFYLAVGERNAAYLVTFIGSILGEVGIGVPSRGCSASYKSQRKRCESVGIFQHVEFQLV